MKKFFLSFIIVIISFHSSGQSIKPEVDERVELLSVVFRLAGNPEYNENLAKNYVSEIHKHFDKYAKHELIQYAKQLRDSSSISFDAVMSMAIHLDYKGNKFTLIPQKQTDLEKRWQLRDAKKFVQLLNNFYAYTDFQLFFKKNQKYYQNIISEFEKILTRFNQNWYSKYYGVKPTEEFKIIIGCGNGGGNYGPSIILPNGKKIVYAIMGSWSFTNEGTPFFREEDYLPIIIHEFNHSFINPLLEKYKGDSILSKSGKIILDTLKTEMTNQAYGNWETLINESLVRASVIRYMMDNKESDKKITQEFITQKNRYFLWTKELVDLLGTYDAQRKQYPDFDKFYPQIIKFFSTVSENIGSIKSKYEKQLPTIISIQPFENNAQDVDVNTKQITINFSEEMADGYSINYGDLGAEHFPVSKITGYENNNKSLKIEVNLKPDTAYEMILTGKGFRSKKGYPIKRYYIKFKTSK